MKKLIFLCVIMCPLVSFASGWYDNDWQYRVKLTTNPAETVGTTTDFVAYVDMSVLPAQFFSTASTTGSDLVVTASDGTTKLSRDLVSLSTASSTGEMHVNLPEVASATGTDIYLYYGNPNGTETNTAAAVWQDYQGVWHVEEEGSTAVSYGVGVTAQVAMDGGDGSWAVLYGADPLNEFIDLAVDEDQLADTERNHTTEELNYWAFGEGDIDIKNSGNVIVGETDRIALVGAASTTITLRNSYTNPVIVSVANIASSASLPAVIRITDVGSNQFTVYMQNPSSNTVTAAPVHYIVMEAGTHTLPGGTLVQAGIETVTGVNRSGNWTSGQMRQVTPDPAFEDIVVLGQVMSNNDTDWQTFWSSNGTQAGPANDTTMYIGRHVGADSDVTRANEEVGYMIIEQGQGATNGVNFVAAVTDDSVQGVTNSPPYSFTTAGGGSGGLVAGVFKDSGANGYDGALRPGVDVGQTGKVGRAIELDGARGSYVPIDGLSYNSTNGLSELTASFWINTTQTTRSGIFDFDRSEHWQVGLNFHNADGQQGQVSFDTANSANGIRDFNSGTTVNDGLWHYVTTVFNSGAVNDKTIYIDGVLANTTDQHTTGLGRPTTRFGLIGDGSEASSFNGAPNNIPQAGLIDELRISHTAQSADQVATTYNNQNSPATFFSVSSVEERNQVPTAPTNLFSNHTSAQAGSVNPSDLALYTPVRFSAVYNDPDSADEADIAHIQVSTDPTFSAVTHWDSGTSTITSTDQGDRITDIQYDSFGVAASASVSMNDGAVTYYWRMRIGDDSGELSVWSSPASFALLDTPVTPSGIGVSKASSTGFQVTWADNSVNEDGFVVERKDNSGGGFGPYTLVATTSSSTYVDMVPLDQAFMYRVSAYNYAGTSTVVEDPVTHYSDPAAPINVFGDYISSSQFDANWTDQSAVVLTDSVEHCIGSTDCLADSFIQVGGGLVTSTSSPLADTVGITADEQIRWRVRADNGVATSNYTYSPYEYTTPGAPSAVSVTYVSDSILNLNWVDNSSYEDGFRILVSIDGGVYSEITPNTNTVGANTTFYSYGAAMPGKSYQFQVQAHVPETTHNSELVSTGTSTVVETSPEAPSNVVASYNSDNDIDISWDDNSATEDLFRVYLRVEGATATPVLIGTTTADIEAFNYTGGMADSFYSFVIESVKSIDLPTNPVELSASSTESSSVYTQPSAPTLATTSVGALTIEWNITDNATYESGFELDQSDGSTFVRDVPFANASSVTEPGLSPNTLTGRTVRAYVENDGVKLYSNPSTSVSVYTLANSPFIATTTIMNVSTTSIDWAWQTESNPTNTEYFATNLTSSSTFGWVATSTWTEIGLVCENSYDFEVRARNQDGLETGVATSTQMTPTCDPTITLPVQSQTVSSSTQMTGTCSDGAIVTISSTDLNTNPLIFTCSGGTYTQTLDFTASTTGAMNLTLSQTKAPFATSSVLSLDVVVDPSSGVDSDADGVSDALEDAGHNGGDGNGDGIADSLQPSVAGVPNIVTGGYTTIESSGACSIVQDAGVSAESTLATQDSTYEYPVGLADYKLQCPSAGATSTVSIYYDQDYDTSAWVLRKYASTTGVYTTVASLVPVVPTTESISSHMLLNGPASTTMVSKISFVIQDGDVLDDDIIANMTIVDPVGPGTLIVTTTSSSGGGGTRYYCRDTNASNYTTRKGREDNGLCKYEEKVLKEKESDRVQDLLNEINQTISSCSPLLSTNMSRNITTNSDDVKDLQNYLNQNEGESLELDGTYNNEDYEAVKRFQNKYKSSVLDIWGLDTATGYVGRTTRLKVNALHCAATTELTCPAFTQYHSRNNPNHGEEVGRLQTLLTDLDFYRGVINNQYDTQTISAVINFQETFSQTMLQPWGLTSGTGYKYKTTNKFMNELYGCSTEDLHLENGNTVSY